MRQTLKAVIVATLAVLGGPAGAADPAAVQSASITIEGERQDFLYYVPTQRPARPGVVLALHGGRGDGQRFLDQTPSLVRLAEREGFIAVYPSADGNWNDGRTAFKSAPSDVTVMRALVDWLARTHGADPARVFVTGVSNGGVMAHKLACDAPDLVAGIAPIAASFNQTLYAGCRPTAPIPVVMFNGTDDPLMVYDGGRSSSRLAKFAPGGEPVIGAEETIGFWARANGCGGAPAEQDLPDRVAGDGTTVTVLSYSCPSAATQLYRINGGGHSVPGTAQRGQRMQRLVGPTSQEIDAMAQAVAFFQRHGL